MILADGSTRPGPTPGCLSFEVRLCDDHGVMAKMSEGEATKIVDDFVSILSKAASRAKSELARQGCSYGFAEWEMVFGTSHDGVFVRIVFYIDENRANPAMKAARAFAEQQWDRYLALPKLAFLNRDPR